MAKRYFSNCLNEILLLGLVMSVGASIQRRQADEEKLQGVTTTASPELPASSGPSKEKSTTPKEFIDESLKMHNYFRKLHHAPELVINETLNEISQSYANKLAAIGDYNLKHNEEAIDAELGENLYFSSTSSPGGIPNANDSINAWYKENENYDYTSGESSNGKEILHFTQVVWKETTQMGVAYAVTPTANKDSMHTTYVVANYYPRGNWGELDEFQKNVFPSSSLRIAGSTSLAMGCLLFSYALCIVCNINM